MFHIDCVRERGTLTSPSCDRHRGKRSVPSLCVSPVQGDVGKQKTLAVYSVTALLAHHQCSPHRLDPSFAPLNILLRSWCIGLLPSRPSYSRSRPSARSPSQPTKTRAASRRTAPNSRVLFSRRISRDRLPPLRVSKAWPSGPALMHFETTVSVACLHVRRRRLTKEGASLRIAPRGGGAGGAKGRECQVLEGVRSESSSTCQMLS